MITFERKKKQFTAITLEQTQTEVSWAASKSGIPLPIVQELKTEFSTQDRWEAAGYTVSVQPASGFVLQHGKLVNTKTDGQGFTADIQVRVNNADTAHTPSSATVYRITVQPAAEPVNTVKIVNGGSTYTAEKTGNNYTIHIPHGVSYTESDIQVELAAAALYNKTIALKSGSPSSLGSTTGSEQQYTITVNAVDGSLHKEYGLTIKRDKNHRAFLKKITVNGTAITKGTAPFEHGHIDYTSWPVELLSSQDKAVIAADIEENTTDVQHNSTGATVNITPPPETTVIPQGGSQLFTITVTPELTTKPNRAYTIKIIRAKSATVTFKAEGDVPSGFTMQATVRDKTPPVSASASGSHTGTIVAENGDSIDFTAQWHDNPAQPVVHKWENADASSTNRTHASVNGLTAPRTVILRFKQIDLRPNTMVIGSDKTTPSDIGYHENTLSYELKWAERKTVDIMIEMKQQQEGMKIRVERAGYAAQPNKVVDEIADTKELSTMLQSEDINPTGETNLTITLSYKDYYPVKIYTVKLKPKPADTAQPLGLRDEDFTAIQINSSGSQNFPSKNGTTKKIPAHSFTVCKYEVTYNLWYEVRKKTVVDTNPYKYNFDTGKEAGTTNKRAPKLTNQPVTNINWKDAVVWCNAVSELEGKQPCYKKGSQVIKKPSEIGTLSDVICDFTANGYRLLSDEEWEFAARLRLPDGNEISGESVTVNGTVYGYTKDGWPSGGTAAMTDNAHGKSTAEKVAWGGKYSNSQGDMPGAGRCHKVGTAGKPDNGDSSESGSGAKNALGLYDMSGNIAEFCWNKPVQQTSKARIRGGSVDKISSNFREIGGVEAFKDVPPNGDRLTGFRICRTITP